MNETGVDVDAFKGHSTRSASTSKACLSDISVDDILSRGSWSNESTWHKFFQTSAFKGATFSGRGTNVVWCLGALNRGWRTGLQSDID